MKKMIVIAALIGGMLMPAQIMAQNNRKNEKPRVENRDKRKDMKPGNNKPGKNNKAGFAINKPGKGNPKPQKYNRPAPRPVVVVNRPAPRPVVVVNNPAPRPCPPPPAPVIYKNYYDNDVAEAAAAVIGLAALIALVAN